MANPKMASLADSHPYPALDASLWTVATGSSYTMVSPHGVKFTPPGSVGAYTSIVSRNEYDLHESQAYANIDTTDPTGATNSSLFSSMMIRYSVYSQSSGETFAFTIYPWHTVYTGTVVSATPTLSDVTLFTNSTLTVAPGATWQLGQWSNARINVGGNQFRITGSTATDATHPNSILTVDGIFVTTPTAGTSFTIERTDVRFEYAPPGDSLTTRKIVTWNPSSFRWLRFTHSTGNIMYYSTSGDGVNYVARYKIGIPSASVAALKDKVEVARVASGDAGRPVFALWNFFNTNRMQQGPTYFSSDVNLVPSGTMDIGQQYNAFKRVI